MLRLTYRSRPALGLALNLRTTIPMMRCHNPPPRVRYTTGPDRAKPTERAAPNGSSENGNENGGSKNGGSKNEGSKNGSENGSENGSSKDGSENGRSKDGSENGRSKNGRSKDGSGEDSDAFHARVWRLLNKASGLGVVSFSAAGLLALDTGYAFWVEKRREQRIYAAFQPAAIPGPPNFVERPTVMEEVRRTITSGTGQYDVILGNHGTGKSTIVEKVASETPGAIYVFIASKGDVRENLAEAFKRALDWEEPTVSWTKVFLQGILKISANGPDGDTSSTKFRRMLEDFERFAAKFKAEYHRPAVLVFDNINIVAKEDPKLLYTLQGTAKEATDKDLYKVVFVCSDGVAPAQMQANSAWSRGPSSGGECRIGDLTSEEAMKYLIAEREISNDQALKIINFCGTRIQLLKRICNELKKGGDLDGYIARTKIGSWRAFEGSGETIDKNRAVAIAKRILEKGPLEWDEYKALCGDNDIGNRFLSNNVFAINSDGLYSFDSKITENAVRDRLNKHSGEPIAAV